MQGHGGFTCRVPYLFGLFNGTLKAYASSHLIKYFIVLPGDTAGTGREVDIEELHERLDGLATEIYRELLALKTRRQRNIHVVAAVSPEY